MIKKLNVLSMAVAVLTNAHPNIDEQFHKERWQDLTSDDLFNNDELFLKEDSKSKLIYLLSSIARLNIG